MTRFHLARFDLARTSSATRRGSSKKKAVYGLLFVCSACVATGLAAQTLNQGPPSVPPPGDQEPITPIPSPPAADPRKLILGEHLFADPRLSHDGTRACLSCHDVRTNGASSHVRDTAPDGTPLFFNTNSVFDAALSFRLDWEGKFRTVEEQAESSLTSSRTLAGRMDEIVARLNADPQLARDFRDIYGHKADPANLIDALATYERSLLTPGSRFDRWLKGDTSALTAEEWNGYQLFKSLGCVSCHQGVNVGGNLFERHGIFHQLASRQPEILRVPSLRNVATTKPYFHDGSAATLHEAVRKMANAQLDRDLSDDQIESIVAFLQTLTGKYNGTLVAARRP